MGATRQVAVSLEHRFFRFNGEVYTRLSFPYQYWQDYLTYFDEVVIVARVEEVSNVDSAFQKVSGPGVKVFDFPYYVGPYQLLKVLPKIILRSRQVAKCYDFFLLRSGNVTNFVWLFAFLYKKKYLREFPGNIKEGVAGVAGRGLVSRVLASFLDSFARLQGRYSCANSFVSEYCRSLYGSSRPDYVFSSFQVAEVLSRKDDYSLTGAQPVVVSVGRLEGEKGHADLVRSLALLSQNGLLVKLVLIGDGRQRQALERLCVEVGVDCEFLGSITDRERLFDTVCSADLFVLPSHTEGMPRALLEAMAMGMPCVGTNVGGIPEVLASGDLVEPFSSRSLADRIEEFIEDIDRRQVAGARNRKVAHSKYGAEVIREKKFAFWGRLYE